MSITGSVTHWIEGLKRGDSQAATEIWKRYYLRLIRVARRRLRNRVNRVADEEDLVTSAFDSFFRRAQQGVFPALHDRDDLWSLLARITHRKVINHIRHHTRQKRGGGRVRGDSVLLNRGSDTAPVEHCLGHDSSPDVTAARLETIQRLMSMLDDDMQQIVQLKLEGHTHQEIATSIQRSVATVERRLRLIRGKWEQELRQ